MSVISIDGRTKVYCGNDAPEENHVENVEDRIDGKDDASKEEKTVKCNGNIAIRCNGQNCEVRCGDGRKVSIDKHQFNNSTIQTNI